MTGAADPSDLLPVEQAFVLDAQAKPDGIGLHWKIADGYYLYRHRTSVKADPGFAAQPLQLPKGKKGRKHELAVVGADCFGLCPKGAVVAVNTAQPDALLVVPAGADLFEVKARLGLSDPRRGKPALTLVEGG